MELSLSTKTGLSVIRSVCKNENGAVLVIGLMFIAILAMLGTTAVVMTTTDMQIGANYKTSVQASNAAQAGINEAIYRLGLFDDGGTNAPPSGSMISVNSLDSDNAAISIDPNGLLSNGADDDGNGATDDISDLNYNGTYDNRNWKTKIMLKTSDDADTTTTVYTPTIQPSGNWIEYSSSTDDGTALTIEFMKDTGTGNIVFYDGSLANPFNSTSGQPVVVVTSTGREGGSISKIQVAAVHQPLDITAESAVMVNMKPALGAAIIISGFNHDGTVVSGDEKVGTPAKWLKSTDLGVGYDDQATIVDAFRTNGADNYGGGNQPAAFEVKGRDVLCTVGSEFCQAYPTAPCCVGGDPVPAEYSCHPSGSPCEYDEVEDYDTDLIEWGWAANDCSIGVNREDWHELEDGVPYGQKLKSTGHKPGIWSTVEIDENANNIGVFGGDKAGITTTWLSDDGNTWMELYEMLGFNSHQELFDAVLAHANVTVADQDGSSGKLEAAPQGVIYIDNAGGDALDIAAATPDYDDGWGLMYITGDLDISTNGFQFKGLVYVEGDLDVSGSPLFVGCLAVKGATVGAGITGSPHILYSADALNENTNRAMKFVILSWKDEGVS